MFVKKYTRFIHREGKISQGAVGFYENITVKLQIVESLTTNMYRETYNEVKHMLRTDVWVAL